MGKKKARRSAARSQQSSQGAIEQARRRWLFPLLAGAVAIALGALLWWVSRHRSFATSRPNVLLVTIDTLRADHLGCYGYPGARTPNLDALAASGVRFATAVAQVPLTTPSHASILTGLTPLRHGIRDNGGYSLPGSVPTLAAAMQRAGYRTAAFVSGFPLDRRFGLDRGFETYDDRFPHGDDTRRAPYVERRADATTALVLAWLEAAPEARPWFAWVHYFDPHAPYEPPADLAVQLPTPYDGEIAFVDAQIGLLVGRLKEKAFLGNTLVLVTADHGESLGEHGEDTHGVFVYDATLRVPWIMAGPGIPAGRVAATVARGIDVAPTLLDAAGIPGPASVEGRSLRRAGASALNDEPAYAESLFSQLNLGWAGLNAWRTARFKFIEAPEPELYDLEADARETRNLFSERPDVAGPLRARLREALAIEAPDAARARTNEVAERLRSLGYLGGAAPARPTHRDPKSAIQLLRRLERGLAEARSNPTLALQELDTVLSAEPDMPLARRYRAIAYQAAGRYAEAVADLRFLAVHAPPAAEDLVLLAETLRLARRYGEALAALDEATRAAPNLPEPRLIRARVLRAMGRAEEAASEYERVLPLAPGHFEAERGLAELAIERGALTEAEPRLEAILRMAPDDVGALLKLGVVRVRSGRLDEALVLFQKAVALAPSNAEALLDLAGALAKSGRPGQAVPYFEEAIRAGGATTIALNGLGFACLESGDTAGALRALRQSLAREPRQARVSEVVAQLSRGSRP